MFHPDWEYIIAAIGIFLSLISLLPMVRLAESKDLTLVSWRRVIRRIPGKGDYDCLTVVFQNLGRDVIYRGDIVNWINIQTTNSTTVEKVFIDSNCKYNKVQFQDNNGCIEFSFDFLEPQKMVRLEILSAKLANEAMISGKIIGGPDFNYRIETNGLWHKYFVGKKEADATMFAFPAATLSSFLILGLVVKRMFNVETNALIAQFTTLDKGFLPIILIGISIGFISVYFGLTIKRLATPFAVFAAKEKTWFRKVTY